MEPEVKDRKTKITKTIICSYRRKIERLYAERLRIRSEERRVGKEC